jgi:hypothetical protein
VVLGPVVPSTVGALLDPPSVSGSLRKMSRQSIKSVPLKGSPPMPGKGGRRGWGVFFQKLLASFSPAGFLSSRRHHCFAATHTDAEGLAEADRRGLPDSLVGEGARPGDDANVTRAVNVARHDANLALVRLDNARAVGACVTRKRLERTSGPQQLVGARQGGDGPP